MSTQDITKLVIDGLYNGAILSCLTIVNSMALDQILKLKSDSPQNSTTLMKFSVLTIAVSAAVFEKTYMEGKGILPDDPLV